MIIKNSNLAMQSYSKNQHIKQHMTGVKVKVDAQEYLDAEDKNALVKEKFEAKFKQQHVKYERSESSLNSQTVLEEAGKTSNKNNSVLALELPDNSAQAVDDIHPANKELSKLDLLHELMNALFGTDYDFDRDYFAEFYGLEPKGSTSIQNPHFKSIFKPSNKPNFDVIEFNHSSVDVEYERSSVEFQASGKIQTADGKTINLNLNFKAMNESFKYNASRIDLKLMKRKPIDPLVINLNSESFGLSDITIDFDLNVDGIIDKINLPNQNMGFLALDKNKNGIIDDGSELFGTQSGDGFKDLAQYDEDNNGWIDENDAVFSKLKLWVSNENGQRLISLKDAKVGAICLKSEDTAMVFKKEDVEKGKLQKTGIFLHENGKAGTIHHIDLSI